MGKKCVQIAIAALLAVPAFAQTAPRARAVPRAEGRVMQHSGAGGGVVGWALAEMGTGGRVVKGAPYSATAVIDVAQTLADGNRIHRETVGAVYRDSEGRTRNETPVAGIPELITIVDPVAGFSYVLYPAEKTAVKSAPSGGRRAPAVAVPHVPGGGGAPGGRAIRHEPGQNVKTEQLGTKTIEGVQADGTRVTNTIPAGLIGNERPIEVVSERWFSPQLQGMVMTLTSDPRMGTNTFRLTKINLGEPDRSLFEIPAGYTIKDGPEGIVGAVPHEPAATRAPGAARAPGIPH